MAKLKDIDQAAASKGKGLETFWQFIKFIVVSLGAFVIQTFLPLLIKLFMSDEFLLRAFDWNLFKSTSEVGLGIFLAANVSNVIAQIVAFFINKEKTFNSDANTAVVLPIYIIFTIALICFSAWLSPTLITFFASHVGENAAISISGACCGAIQFFLYFPVDKILFHKKKEDKTAENKEEAKEETASK